ncbi:MAG: ankyrin repeat domain-containing protein [Gammaproteobacteria bacterium]
MQRATIYSALENQDYIGLPPLERSLQKDEKSSLTPKEINAKDEYNRTWLHIAVCHGDIAFVRFLLNHAGIKIDAIDEFGFTPFLLAAAKGYTEILNLILEKNPASAKMKNGGNTALHYAVTYQHIDVVKILLKIKQINVNTKNTEELTALNYAVLNQDVVIASFLLAHKADPNSIAKENSEEEAYSILHSAVETGCLDMVNLLLNTGAKTDRAYGKCYSPLNTALLAKHIFIAETILARNINEKISPWKMAVKDSDGNTLLHAAARNGHLNVVKMLLSQKADTTIKNKGGFTAIDEATKNGHLTVAALLPGKDQTKQTIKPLRHVRFSVAEDKEIKHLTEIKDSFFQKKTQIFKLEKGEDAAQTFLRAVNSGHGTYVEWLLKNTKVDLATKDEKGDTALHIAANKGFLSIIKILLKAKPKLAKEVNRKDETPLYIAMNKAKAIRDSTGMNAEYEKQLYIAEMLFKHHPDIYSQDNEGFTPLRKAVQTGLINMVSLILPLIANTTQASVDESECYEIYIENGKEYAVNILAPLHYAAESGFIDIMRLLLKEGANTEIRDCYDNTPLHRVARTGQLQAVKLLLDNDAKIDAINGNGSSVLHIAVRLHQTEVVSLLLEYDVPMDLKDQAGLTAFEYAQKLGFSDIVNLFTPKEALVVESSRHRLFVPVAPVITSAANQSTEGSIASLRSL